MNEKHVNIQLGKYEVSIIAFTKKGFHKEVNQDNYSIFYNNESCIIAVSDGLGSASQSSIGSQLLCEETIELLKITEVIDIHKLINNWKSKIHKQHTNYDSTLKFIRLGYDELTVGSIGDGWIGVLQEDEYTEIDSKKTFSNQTDSILSTNIDEVFIHSKYHITKDFLIILATDGFSDDIDDYKREEFMKSIKIGMESIDLFYLEMEQLVNHWPNQTNSDDITVVIIKGDFK